MGLIIWEMHFFQPLPLTAGLSYPFMLPIITYFHCDTPMAMGMRHGMPNHEKLSCCNLEAT